MLTLNIDVSDSVANGYTARVKSKTIHEVAVPVVPVHSVTIELHTATVTLDRKMDVSCHRKQFPIMQESAVTIHKSQGGTYSQVVYDYHKRHPQKLVEPLLWTDYTGI